MTATASKPALTGGCQCGAIRFRCRPRRPRSASAVARMCLKATGAPFASLADIPNENFTWTRGKPAAFKSSSIAERDFCAKCGTPLSYRAIGGPKIEIMTGAFDRPDRVVPTQQFGAGHAWAGSATCRTCRARRRCRISDRRNARKCSAISIRIMIEVACFNKDRAWSGCYSTC